MNKKQLIEVLKREGFSGKVLDAFSKVKREDFIPDDMKQYAYENGPLPIGYGATISQPYTIAFMLDLLELEDGLMVLEIGSGSGYVLALINEMCKGCKIHGIERIEELVESSRLVLKGHKNIEVICADGSKGIKGKKFDRILISAAASDIPSHLYSQLNDNGIIVSSVQDSIFQIKKVDSGIEKKEYPGFVFVPLVEED